MNRVYLALWRRLLATLVVAFAAISATGCATLPTSGAIKIGPSLENALEGEVLYYSPSGPSSGASQTDIVSGFLTAGTGPQNDYEVARQYLTEDFRPQWQPTREVLVQNANGSLLGLPGNRATYQVQVSSRVNLDGQFSNLTTPESRILDFELVREKGEWRIAQAPNLTVLIRPVFEVLFKPYKVYFYDNSLRYLVPDVRWFPSRASTSTRLVNAVLNGSSSWLEGSVQSAVPRGTKLALDSVTVNSGVAVVDLNAQALKATPLHRQYIKAQLTATLAQVPGVSSVSLLIAGTPVVVPDYSQPQPPAFSYAPVMLDELALHRVSSAGSNTIAGTANFVSELKPSEFALDAAEDQVAFLNQYGIYRARLSDLARSPELIDSRPDLMAPQIDSRGYIWSISKNPNTAIYSIDSSDSKLPQTASWLFGRKKVDFSISPEGSRIAIISVQKGVTLVEVAGIIRDREGKPSSIGAPLHIAKDVLNPTAIAWQDESTVAVLGASPAVGASLVYSVQVGGTGKSLAALPLSRSLAANTTNDGYFAITRTGDLMSYGVFDWNLVATNVKAVHFSH